MVKILRDALEHGEFYSSAVELNNPKAPSGEQMKEAARLAIELLDKLEWGSCDGCGGSGFCPLCGGATPPSKDELEWIDFDPEYHGHKDDCPMKGVTDA